MPIAGLTEQRRLPRLGKIHLGVKKVSEKSGKEYPSATDYFVVSPELAKALGNEKPTELPIMIPVEDDEIWCSQYYKRYSSYRGLTCKGDGVTCRRMIDTATGDMAGRETKDIAHKTLQCDGRKCIYYSPRVVEIDGKKRTIPQECKETMNLQFIMPDLPGFGVWQVDTSSINSIRNINNAAAMIRAVYKRIAFIPLVLTIEPIEVVNPDDGQKKVVRVLNLRTRLTMRELMSQSKEQAHQWLALPTPAEDEAPEDDDGTYPADAIKKPDPVQEVLGTPEAVVYHREQNKAIEKNIDELYGDMPDGGRQKPKTESDADFEKMGEERDRLEEERKAKKAAEDPVKKQIDEPKKLLEKAENIQATGTNSPVAGFIDMEWLRETLNKLQRGGLKAYSNKNLLSYIKTAYAVDGDTPSVAIAKLTKEQSQQLVGYIQEALRMV
ncbi:MAG: hypothetical protein PHQ86_01830 [Dehalococcoidales bacterium]|nr:hypothetical protein [Dehalococcoidales bacterium]